MVEDVLEFLEAQDIDVKDGLINVAPIPTAEVDWAQAAEGAAHVTAEFTGGLATVL